MENDIYLWTKEMWDSFVKTTNNRSHRVKIYCPLMKTRTLCYLLACSHVILFFCTFMKILFLQIYLIHQ